MFYKIYNKTQTVHLPSFSFLSINNKFEIKVLRMKSFQVYSNKITIYYHFVMMNELLEIHHRSQIISFNIVATVVKKLIQRWLATTKNNVYTMDYVAFDLLEIYQASMYTEGNVTSVNQSHCRKGDGDIIYTLQVIYYIIDINPRTFTII